MHKVIETVRTEVSKFLGNDKSGHGLDHIDRVVALALRFADELGNCDKYLISLIALLHDVDDYKLVGDENAENLTNTRQILNKCGIDEIIQNKVIKSVNCIGFRKRLKGVVPNIAEGKIVSDADMCDALGAVGILRTYDYNLTHGHPIFDRNVFPNLNMDSDKYSKKRDGTFINHFFEKLLKLKKIMLTDSGKNEANKRHDFMLLFLHQFFKEENEQKWDKYLSDYEKEC